MKILTHPDNLDLIKQKCDKEEFGKSGFLGIEIVAERHMDRDKSTGRYILPNGKAVPRDQVTVADGPFFEWGSSDLEIKLLLEWGLIKEEREPLFYLIKDELLRSFWNEPFMTVKPPKWFITTCA
jgi:hypothetical protein